MSKLELVFTGNDGKVLKSIISNVDELTRLDVAEDAQIHLDYFAEMISDYDFGDGDSKTLMCPVSDEDYDDNGKVFIGIVELVD